MPRITTGNIALPLDPKKEVQPKITDVGYKHSIVSSRRQPITALLTHIEGSSWSVYYYSQLLGKDEEPSPFNPNQDSVLQQYYLIKNMELKVQGSINNSTDPQDQSKSITGTAIMYPYMKPNYGDCFIADMGDGGAGLFTVTNVESMSYFKVACYQIQFKLAQYMDLQTEENLKEKTQKSTEFVKDFLMYGQNPILATTDKLKLDTIDDAKSDALTDWLSEFYSNEFKTILVPSSNFITYDPFMTKLITTVFDKDLHPLLKNISLLNVDDRNMNLYIDIWHVLIHREIHLLRNAFDEYYLVNTKSLNGNPFLQTVYWSGIQRVLLPKKEGVLTDERLGFSGTITGELIVDPTTSSYTKASLPMISGSGNYVFSQEFYHNPKSTNLTDLEYMVRDYLNNRAIDWEKLVSILEDRHEWSRIQRFYLVPVCLLLLIAEERRI